MQMPQRQADPADNQGVELRKQLRLHVDLVQHHYRRSAIQLEQLRGCGLPGGGELQLSRMDYVTPKGRRLESDGVEPDVKVTRTLADLRAGRDGDLEAALRVWAEGR